MCGKLIFAECILGDICGSPKDTIVNNSKASNIFLTIVTVKDTTINATTVWPEEG